jgi:hypothetical protein
VTDRPTVRPTDYVTLEVVRTRSQSPALPRSRNSPRASGGVWRGAYSDISDLKDPFPGADLSRERERDPLCVSRPCPRLRPRNSPRVFGGLSQRQGFDFVVPSRETTPVGGSLSRETASTSCDFRETGHARSLHAPNSETGFAFDLPLSRDRPGPITSLERIASDFQL